MTESTTPFNPAHLFERRRIKDMARLKAYNKILDQIYKKVTDAAKVPGITYILYTIPPFILGLPKPDLEDLVTYLIFQLRKNFEARYSYPTLIYVSWKQLERNYIMKDSPILKSMLGEPESKQQKSRVRFADTITDKQTSSTTDTTTRVFSANGGKILAPARSAGSYTPPTSFLNNLEAPQTRQQEYRQTPAQPPLHPQWSMDSWR